MCTPCFPDYDNSILNITATLLRHYGAASDYAPLADIEAALRPAPRNVVLLILDGMGEDMLRRNLDETSFLRAHTRRSLTSVFPSTTTAALTSFYSGLSPIQHGWLGWSLFFKEYGAAIDVFPNRYSATKEKVGGSPDAAYRYMPYETIFEQLHHQTDGALVCHTVIPSDITFPDAPNINHRVDSFPQLCAEVAASCAAPGRKLVTAYWPEPDSTMHALGCYADETRALVAQLDQEVAAMADALRDTLLIVTADHGQIDVTDDLFLNDMPELEECLVLPPDIEARALGFSVKEECMAAFPARFAERFGERYLLYTRQQVLDSGLMGRGAPHPKARDFLGDYLACAADTSMLRYRVHGGIPPHPYKGLHAGLDAREMLVPLILLRR